MKQIRTSTIALSTQRDSRGSLGAVGLLGVSRVLPLRTAYSRVAVTCVHFQFHFGLSAMELLHYI